MVSYIETHPEAFEEAIKLSVLNKQPYSKRAAWLLWSCMKKNDTRIQKHIKTIVNTLPKREDDHLRELLIILQKMKLDEEYEGELFDICVSVWEKINKKPSVRYNAFKMIVKIAKKHPDLFHEVNFLTQNQYTETLSPGVKHSIFKMIKKLS